MCQNPPEKLDQNFISRLSALGNEKAKPFIENETLKEKIAEFFEVKDENLQFFRKRLFKEQIEEYRKKAEELHSRTLPRAEKSILLKEFNTIRERNKDLLELQMKAFDVQELLDSIRVSGKKNH